MTQWQHHLIYVLKTKLKNRNKKRKTLLIIMQQNKKLRDLRMNYKIILMERIQMINQWTLI